MSDHAHDHTAHVPTNFWSRYVFSIDHKVIGIQFIFASLFFVIIGGLLALGVRYQLAWPNQHVPYWKLVPPSMTNDAPEANPAHWKQGHEVTLLRDATVGGQALAKDSVATFRAFPEGIAVTLPAGLRVSRAGGEQQLSEPVEAYIDASLAMGDYAYSRQQVRTSPGATVRVGDETWTVLAYEVPTPDHGTTDRPILLAVNAAKTPVALEVDGNTLTGEGAVTADAVSYMKRSLTPDAYAQLFTMHATVMIFFVMMPVLMGGFGNFLIPLMIGARDMAFPKLNMLSFWLAVPSGIILLIGFFTPGGHSGGGWTMYPPLSLERFSSQVGTTIWLIAVGLVGFSTIVGTLNYITTIINMRAPGMTMFRMPLTIWSLLITSVLALFATPVLTAAAILLLFDRVLGTHFFETAAGGQPLMWQHLFWYFGHPEVYILILPTMGITSDVISNFARKPIFGYKPMVFAICAIAGLGFIVWGHHMFQSGMNPVLGTTFMASTVMIALPSAIKTFNWLGTLWGGNIRFTVPMLWALGFVSMFVIGGLSGIFMASAPVDIHLHDTYFIVAHIHYVLFGGTMMGVFAGIYYWFPKMFGRQMDQRWGYVHFFATFIAFNGTFFLMHILGIGGHPRRYASIMEYPTLQHLQPLNVFMTIWALALGLAQIPFFYNFFVSMPRKLGRAMTAVFAIMLGGPMVIASTYWGWWPGICNTGQTLFGWLSIAEADRTFWPAIIKALLAGGIYSVIVVVAVWLLWAIGGALKLRVIVEKSMYLWFLPLFLSPMILKQDMFVFRGHPGLHEYRWVILALLAVPGLLYLVIRRPKDQFGAPAEVNPWEANSLEWATSSPPPVWNFDVIPTVYRGPYEYSSPVVEEDYLPQTKQLPAGVVEPQAH